MKNIQVIDGATNATFSIFQATDDEFALIFPDGRDIDTIEDVIERLGEAKANEAVAPMWERPILKRDANGIHGTLLYDAEERRRHLPLSRREVDWKDSAINEAQRKLFRQNR